MKTLKTTIFLAVFALAPFATAHADSLGWNSYVPFQYVSGGTVPATNNSTSSTNGNAGTTTSTGSVAGASTTSTTSTTHTYVAPKPTPKPVVTTASTKVSDACGSDDFKTVNPELQTASVGSVGSGFLPHTFLEWFVIIVLVFAIVFFARYLYSEREKQMQAA